MIDHEGGRVNRFNKIFSQKKYTADYFGKLYLTDRKNFYKETSNFIEENNFYFKMHKQTKFSSKLILRAKRVTKSIFSFFLKSS